MTVLDWIESVAGMVMIAAVVWFTCGGIGL